MLIMLTLAEALWPTFSSGRSPDWPPQNTFNVFLEEVGIISKQIYVKKKVNATNLHKDRLKCNSVHPQNVLEMTSRVFRTKKKTLTKNRLN